MRHGREDHSRLLRPGQFLGALFTSISVAAVAVGAIIENWGRSAGIVVGAIAVAVISITAAVVQQRMVVRRAEERLLRTHVRVLDRGRLPRVGGPASAPVDDRLAEALRTRWFVVATGEQALQAAAEAVRAAWPYRRILVPTDGRSLSALLAELDLSGTVVWLGDLGDYMRGDGATTSLLDRLAIVPDLTVVATCPGGAAPDLTSLPPEATGVLGRATVVAVSGSRPAGDGTQLGSATVPVAVGGRSSSLPAALLVTLAMAGVMFAGGASVSESRSCGEFPAELRVVTSSELTPILRQLAAQFRREVSAGGCQRANVQVQPTTSAGATIEALSRGWSREDHRELAFAPDVLIPDSTVDVQRVQRALERSDSKDVTLVPEGSIAISPIVLAAPRSSLDDLTAAGILDRADGIFRWSKLTAKSSGVGIVRASPRSSSAGFAATYALYRAALAGASGAPIDRQALVAPGAALRLRDVELTVESRYEETSALLCALRLATGDGAGPAGPGAGESRLLIPLVAERSIVDYNEGRPLGGECAADSAKPTDPLVPLIAEDGTPFLDYPVVRVLWSGLSQSRQRRAVIDQFVRFLHQDVARRRLLADGFRDQNKAVGNPMLNAYRPAPVPMPDGPLIDGILVAWKEARQPTRMLLAVDVSRSMRPLSRGFDGNHLDAAVAAIENSLRLIGDRDQIGLWESSAAEAVGYRERISIGPPGTNIGNESRAEALRRQLAGLQAGTANSAIAQTVRAAIDALQRSGGTATEPRSALVVLTAAGGGTIGAEGTPAGVRRNSPGQRVPVFLIVFGTQSCATTVAPGLRETIVDSGGGCFTVESASDVRRALDGLAAGLWSGQP